MKKFCYVMLLALMFLNNSQIDAEANYCSLKSYVFFGNGMFNEQTFAEAGLRKIKREMIEAGSLSDEEWSFELSYNHNEVVYSLFEVYRQSMGDQAASFWRWLGSSEVAPDWFQQATREIASTYDLAEAVIDDDLYAHVQRYKGLLMEGNRILVVAHSQGNLYANAAYTNLASDNRMPMDAFGILSVATPASRVAGGGAYYTLMYDLVIASVSMAMPNILPGNVTNTMSDTDWLHHSFIDSYLNGDQSGALIVNSALSQANALSWPTPQVGSGPISVTLNWGAQPDVDLHVYEPGGSHVFYLNPLGTSGYLDRDDVSSFGPEHYYVVDCDSLATGVYHVGVNYYYGEAPETASVLIQAGDVVRDYTIRLPMPEGSDGDYSPDPVASIVVTGDPANGYEFTVAGMR